MADMEIRDADSKNTESVTTESVNTDLRLWLRLRLRLRSFTGDRQILARMHEHHGFVNPFRA